MPNVEKYELEIPNFKEFLLYLYVSIASCVPKFITTHLRYTSFVSAEIITIFQIPPDLINIAFERKPKMDSYQQLLIKGKITRISHLPKSFYIVKNFELVESTIVASLAANMYDGETLFRQLELL